MAAKSQWFAVTALFTVSLVAFFTGRGVEERALTAKASIPPHASASPAPAIEPAPPSHRQLAVAEILGLPFADFYEALRSAPGEALEKWAGELAAMPEGPRRTSAVSGFYKLLVQFDPTVAIKAIRELEDVRLQTVALGSAVDATPGFAMQAIAELCLSLEDRTSVSSKRDYLSDVLVEWMQIDAPAVAQFIDDHPVAESYENFVERQLLDWQLISTWATLDPKAAKQWIDKKGKWEDSSENRDAFIGGWYENDRAAAVSYALANVEDPLMEKAISDVVFRLYIDSKEEAAKFIESLPEEKRPDALTDGFRNLILGDEEDTGETLLTPRAIASWMMEFPPAYWKGALGRLFGFSGSGADDMVSWIEQQPPSIREVVAAEFTVSFETSPSKAIMRVLGVADPTLRDQLFRAMLKNGGPDFDETRATITSAPISFEQKNHLLQIVATAEAEED